MKTKTTIVTTLLSLVFAFGMHAQGTAFTYQGRVTDSGTNFTGAGQFKFALVTSTNTSRTATATANAPSNGYITGYAVVDGGTGYLTAPIVTVSGGGGSGAAGVAVISGGVVTGITVTSTGDGQYTSAPTVTIAPPPASIAYTTYWSNDGTSMAGSEPSAAVAVNVNNGLFTVVLGDATLANMTAINPALFAQPDLQLRIWFNDGVNGFAALDPAQTLTPTPYAVTAQSANGLPALFVQQNSEGAPNIIAGSTNNFVAGGVVGATIGGGGAVHFSGISYTNQVAANFGTVAGGIGNTSGDTATVGGGIGNNASGLDSTIGGGHISTAAGQYATVGGGLYNHADATASTVAGGDNNNIGAAADHATIAGGNHNQISGYESTIAGGYYNGISAQDSVVAGGDFNTINPGANQSFIGGGLHNTNNAAVTTIAGGQNNLASGASSTIGGGYYNKAEGSWSTVAGGDHNQATNDDATVSGGSSNTAQGNDATIAGGLHNGTSADYAAVGGGYGNSAQGYGGTIPGGINNRAFEAFSTVGGGNFNQAFSNSATIGGGLGNVASGVAAVVGGGVNNTSGNFASTVAGGTNNQAAGVATTISGGSGNFIANRSDYAFIGGGSSNNIYALSDHSFIGSGDEDQIQSYSEDSVIGGGYHNSIQSSFPFSFLGGGSFNNIAGMYAFIGGGFSNSVAGVFGTVLGGDQNRAGPDCLAAGHRAKAMNQGSFVWADSSQNADFSSTAANQFLIRASGGVGINTTGPAGALSVNTGVGTLTVRNDAGLTPGIDIANGYQGTLRLRNAMEVWPSDDQTRAGRLDVRDTNGTPTITLDGQTGNLNANNTSGVNWGQSNNENITIGTGGYILNVLNNLKPAPGYFVITASVNANFNNSVVVLRLYDTTSTTVELTDATATGASYGTINLSWVLPISAGGGYERFELGVSTVLGTATITRHNLTILYVPRLND